MIASFWRSYSSFLGAFLWMLIPFLQEGQCHPKTSQHCAAYVAQYEKHHGIPTGLLQAISKVESGRKDKTGHLVAWPWTVNAEGKGYHFPTKEAAMAAVRDLQFKGIKSIDVGCMQINLYYHPYAFKSLNDAFDPQKNVEYAALFLTKLKSEHASWDKAVSRYHSANPLHHIPYKKNVVAVWLQDRKNRNIHLAAGVFENARPSSSRITRLRRLATTRNARLDTADVSFSSPSATKAVVRKITGASRHLKRLAKVTTTTRRHHNKPIS